MKLGAILILLAAGPSLCFPIFGTKPGTTTTRIPVRPCSRSSKNKSLALSSPVADGGTSAETGRPGSDKATIVTSSPSSSLHLPSPPSGLTEEERDFCRGYLNKHHGDLLLRWVEIFTPLGAEVAKANVWSGGSMELQSATIAQVQDDCIEVHVQVARRNQPETTEDLILPLDADPIPEKTRQYPTLPPVPSDDASRWPLDDWVRRAARLCWIARMPAVTGKLTQLALQLSGNQDKQKKRVGELPPNMFLNQVPHNRFVRQYFYDTASEAVLESVVLCGQHRLLPRMQVIAQFPELNPSMDSYRIGTLLELARALAIRLAEENLRVRVCVQQSMGVGIFTGLPKQLGGVAKLLQLMDWQSNPGEENEGMVGNYVNFGGVGADHVVNERRDPVTSEIVQHQDDVFLLVAPQSMVGTDSSILPLLQEMVAAAGDRPVILINPDLTDKVSSGGQQSVRGRQERLDFAQSFRTVYCFQNIYISGTSYFPILGAMTKNGPLDPWVAHQRRDLLDGGEMYVPILMAETRPEGDTILDSFER